MTEQERAAERETVTAAIKANDHKPILHALVRRFEVVGPDGLKVSERVNSHCMAKHGVPLGAYVANGATPQDKCAFLMQCLAAAVAASKPETRDHAWDGLEGGSPRGQAAPDRDALAAERAQRPEAKPEAPRFNPEPKAPVIIDVPAPAAPTGNTCPDPSKADPVNNLTEAIRKMIGQSAGGVTEDRVREIVSEVVNSRILDLQDDRKAMIKWFEACPMICK